MEHNEIIGEMELPMNNTETNETLNLVKGWVFSKDDKELLVEIYVNGNLRKRCKSGFPRYDIFKTFSSEESYLSGFMDRIELTSGSYDIQVIASNSEHKKEIGNVTVVRKKNGVETLKKNRSFFQPIPGADKWPRWLNKKYIDFFVKNGHLKPNHKVLDVGPGMGRITMSLTKFLTEGEYHGLETVNRAVEYCKENISSRYPNFYFKLADVYNKAYNREGKYKCSDYKFPYDDNTFDFVILSSVFTHLVSDDMKNYLHEVSRVLKKEGYCYITFVLLNENSLNRIEKSLTEKKYDFKFDGYRVREKDVPERAVAYEEDFVEKVYSENGLVVEKIHYGRWAGFKESFVSQDIIIAKKN